MPRELHFNLACSDTRFGWHLRVVGSCQSLGSWNPKLGLPLSTSAADFPIWKPERLLLLEDDSIEYKYVVCDDHGNTIRWEDTSNRSLCIQDLVKRGTCPSSGPIVVSEFFNTPVAEDHMRFQVEARRRASQAPTPASSISSLAPTMRERIASRSRMAAPTSARKESTRQDATPEVTTTRFHIESQIEDAVLSGLIREESGSNLPFVEVAVDELCTKVQPEALKFEQQYTLLGTGPLGEGTFGLVWRCQATQGKGGGAERAAKIIRKKRLQPHEREYLLGDNGEIQTHLQMKHCNIVELFEYFDEVENVTLVLEYCQGGDLFDAIIAKARANGRGLPENEAARASKHTCAALAYLHRRSVCHRDIKCENILLAQVGVPLAQNVFKLCDFGFAAVDKGQGFLDRLGSPDTVAPEVVAGTTYSFPADMWSLGALIYMMLAAASPFKAATDAEVLRKVHAGSYSLQGALWDGISAPPKHAITSLMVVDAKLRPTAEEALQKAWLTDA